MAEGDGVSFAKLKIRIEKMQETSFNPTQLAHMDTERLTAYRTNLDFYKGNQWPTTSRHRQLVFNYAKVSIDKVTSFLMQGFTFSCFPAKEDQDVLTRVRRAEQVLHQVYQENNFAQLDYETEIDTAILGDGCYKVIWDHDVQRIRITAPDVSGIFAWWLGDDLSRVWRVASRYQLTRDEIQMLYGDVIASVAKQSQGIATSPRFIGAPRNNVVVTELWTDKTFDLYLDTDLIESRPNPYGFIPFIIFPKMLDVKVSSCGSAT